MARIFITGSADGLGQLASKALITKRDCLDKEMQKLETEFLKALSEATNFQIQGEFLGLYKGEERLLTFNRMKGN